MIFSRITPSRQSMMFNWKGNYFQMFSPITPERQLSQFAFRKVLAELKRDTAFKNMKV